MAALHWQDRLAEPAMESVDDVTQVEQIAEAAEAPYCSVLSRGRAIVGVTFVPVGPFCGNERAAAVGQAYKHEQDATPPNAADRGQSLALEHMALPEDRHRRRAIAVMGSLWPHPSTRSRTIA
jgi:hypothetical protein